jgi:tetratricopeptide (TPR) repeat protein
LSFLTKFRGNMGWLAHARGNIEGAEKLYRRAIAQDSTDAKVYAGLTGICVRRGDFEEAYDIIRQGIEKSKVGPKNRLAIKSLTSQYVITLWKLGRLEEAISEMEKIHEEVPSANSYGTLGYLYIEQGDKTGDYEKALEFNMGAVDYADDDANILDNLAQVYYRLGKIDEAEEYFRKALEDNPEQMDTIYYLAKVRFEKGDIAEAKTLIEKVLERDISKTATISREMVDSLAQAIAAKE